MSRLALGDFENSCQGVLSFFRICCPGFHLLHLSNEERPGHWDVFLTAMRLRVKICQNVLQILGTSPSSPSIAIHYRTIFSNIVTGTPGCPNWNRKATVADWALHRHLGCFLAETSIIRCICSNIHKACFMGALKVDSNLTQPFRSPGFQHLFWPGRSSGIQTWP